MDYWRRGGGGGGGAKGMLPRSQIIPTPMFSVTQFLFNSNSL